MEKMSPTSIVEDQMFNWPKPEKPIETFEEIDLNGNSKPHHVSKSHFIYNVSMDFLIVLIAGLEAGLVLSVAFVHFLKYKDSKRIEAGFISLLPLFYNYIGVIWFLSKKQERIIIEKIFPKRPYLTDIFQIPVFGPFLTTLSVFVKSWSQKSEYEYYERLEASATKMRQSVTFFSSAPESIVIISFRIIEIIASNLSLFIHISYLIYKVQLSMIISLNTDLWMYWLEIATIFIAFVAIAEANVYSVVTDYYKLFHKSDEKSWKVAHAVKFSQKIFLFLHAFFSVATNLLSRTFLLNAVVYYLKEYLSPIFITVIFFITHIFIRQWIFYVSRILKHIILEKTMPSTTYDSFNYGWRTAVLNTDFQSDLKVQQVWFYFESAFGYFLWLCVTLQGHGPFDIDHISFMLFSFIFCSCFILSILGLFLTRYYLKLDSIQDFVIKSNTLFSELGVGVANIGVENARKISTSRRNNLAIGRSNSVVSNSTTSTVEIEDKRSARSSMGKSRRNTVL